MSKTGCYVLHLYCDRVCPNLTPEERPYPVEDMTTLRLEHQFPEQHEIARGPYPLEVTGNTERDCITQAKRIGWYIHGKRVLCPACAREFGKV